LLLHAAGPSSPSLSQLTADYWPILLGLRSHAINNPPLLEAILFSILTLLELNEGYQDRLVKDHAKLMLESQEWARLILEGAEASGGEEVERIRMLAAGVVLRCGEVVEKYRRLLLGDMIDY
jgi:telomere length regulation protein